MQYGMDINAGTKRLVEAFATSAVNYFFNQEIESLGCSREGVLWQSKLRQRLDLGWNLDLHNPSLRCITSRPSIIANSKSMSRNF